MADEMVLETRGLTRVYGAGILISEAAKATLDEARPWQYRFIDDVTIRGRRGSTIVWEVLAPTAIPSHARRIDQLVTYNRGLEALNRGSYDEARRLFAEVLAHTPEDQVARSYLERAGKACGVDVYAPSGA